jgi:drug/metabolite transporter (DMT)-like permease
MTTQTKVHGAAVIASILWASAFIGGKYALGYIPPLHLAGFRLLTAGAMLLLVLRKNPLPHIRGVTGWVLLLSFFQIIVVFSAFNFGLSRVPGSFGAVIIGSSPAVSSLTAVIMLKDEHMTLRKAFGLLIGLAGIVVLAISREPWTVEGREELLGAGLLMICNISTAVGAIIMKKKLHTQAALSVSTVQILFGGIVLTAAALLFEQGADAVVTVPIVGSIVYLAFVTAAAVTLWLFAIKQKQTRISTITMWKFLIPSLGPILSWLFMRDDEPTISMGIGIVTIIIAILFTVSAPDRNNTDMQRIIRNDIMPSIGE